MNNVVPLLDLDCENHDYAKRMALIFVGNREWHYVADFKNLRIEKTGKRVPQYRDIPGAPTGAEFLTHLQGKRGGNVGLLVIPITAEGACRWGKIDVDVYAEDRIAAARKYAKAIKRLGLPLVVELSKSGGFHLAHYSQHSLSAHDMRAKLADWAGALNCPLNKFEIFPKQERLDKGQKANGINLPYHGGDSDATVNYAIDEAGNRMSVDRWLKLISSMKPNAEHTPGEVDVEGAADFLSQHWTDGQRDNLNLAVAGALLRAGLEPDVVQEILDGARGIAADGDTYKSAKKIAQDIDADKRVPGYPRLAELMGKEDAQEFMRLCGSKPPPDLVRFEIEAMPAHWAATAPPAVVFAVEPLFPRQVAAVVAAEGGAGKTGFGLTAALCVATGRPFFELPVTKGIAVYIALEENANSLWRRFHKIIGDEVLRMQDEGYSPESIEQFHADHAANLFPVAGAGLELHLIRSVRGDVTMNEPLIDRLIEKMPHAPTFITIDPIARTHGTDENANHVSTALINAGERIAQQTGAAFLFMHHVGKEAMQKRDMSMNAARGGSALIAGARSSIRLAPVIDAAQFTNVSKEIIEAGDLIEVIHNKLNDGKKSARFYLLRQALAFERFEPLVSSDSIRAAQALGALFAWYVNNGNKPFSQNEVVRTEAQRGQVFGGKIGRDRAIEIVQGAIGPGDLIVGKDKKLRFREDFAGDSM